MRYEPDQQPDLHTHPFARVLITGGVLQMTYPQSMDELTPGQVCDVPAETGHAECCGASGATGLLGTRESWAKMTKVV